MDRDTNMRVKIINGPVARNPVAKAVARQKLKARLTSAKLRIFMLDPGVDDSEYLAPLMHVLLVIARAAEFQWPDTESMPVNERVSYNIIRGGCSAIESVLRRWDPAQAVAIEQAIDRAEMLNAKLRSECIYDANADLNLLVQEYR